MTAIVWQYLPNGSVIGADGRRKEFGAGAVTENAQKVYGVRVSNLRLAYAWSGMTKAQRLDGVEIDFKHWTDLVLQTLNIGRPATFSEFVEGLANGLHVLLLKFIGDGVKSFDKPEIAQLLLLGFIDENPYVAELLVKHDTTTVLRPKIIYHSASTRFEVFSGSKRVYDEMEETLKMEPPSFHEASERVSLYTGMHQISGR